MIAATFSAGIIAVALVLLLALVRQDGPAVLARLRAA